MNKRTQILKQLASERGKDSITVINERLEEMEYMYNEALKRGLPIGLVFPGSAVTEPMSDDIERANKIEDEVTKRELFPDAPPEDSNTDPNAKVKSWA